MNQGIFRKGRQGRSLQGAVLTVFRSAVAGCFMLLDGMLIAAIDLHENGNPVSGEAWTGTQSVGTGSNATCSDWTDDTGSSSGTQGTTSKTGAWTQLASTAACDFARALYCFSASPVLL